MREPGTQRGLGHAGPRPTIDFTSASSSRHDLDALPTSSALARQHARRALYAWHVARSDIDTVELVVSELVTNAVRHSGAAGAEAVRLSLRLVDSHVLVQVFDPCPRMPRLVTASAWDERGRGLRLVAALSSRWGAARVVVDGRQVGKRVWAIVPVHVATPTGAEA